PPPAVAPVHQPQQQLQVEEVLPQPLLQPQQNWSVLEVDHLDTDSYLVARAHHGPPLREESTEPLLAPTSPPTTAAHTPTITTSHAHNPAYSPTSELPPPPPLHYSTL
ncbi:hypothetical protein OTU49_008369, partial [Cherax quadricarinatus]